NLPRPALARMVRAVVLPHQGDFEQPHGANLDTALWTQTPSGGLPDKTNPDPGDLVQNESRMSPLGQDWKLEKGDRPHLDLTANAPPGTYFVDRDQPALSSNEVEVIRRFHELYYRHWLGKGADTVNLSWFGHQLVKCPLDLWIYQELLVRTRPDFVVE